VGGIDPSFRHAEDFDLFVKITQKFRARAVQDTICIYRVHGGNMTTTLPEVGFQECLAVVSRYLPLRAAAAALRYQHTYQSVRIIKDGKIIAGLRYLFQNGSWAALLGEILRRAWRLIRVGA
jgi:hypothetical protein